MAKESIDARQALREIVGQVHRHLMDWKDLGLEAPGLSRSGLVFSDGGPEKPAASSLAELQTVLAGCTGCPLHAHRRTVVFGEGAARAELIFIGAGPSREEDQQGRPFQGEAGGLLTKIIGAMGLKREQVYLTHVVKCRPPEDRDPAPGEIEACRPFLNKQIELIGPKVICTLGPVAGQSLAGGSFQLGQQRGAWHTYREIPLMPTLHPAHLLADPSAKRQVWEDVQKIMRRLGLEVGKNA